MGGSGVRQVLGVDVGDQVVTAMVITGDGALRGRTARPAPVEDPDAVWAALLAASADALAAAGTDTRGLAALGLATPGDVALAWSRATLRPWGAPGRGLPLPELLGRTPGAPEAAARGDLTAGTLDAWLLARLTNGDVEATEPSHAAAAGLYDPVLPGWSVGAGVPHAALPALRPSVGLGAVTDPEAFLDAEVPVAGVAARPGAALFGQAGWTPGIARTADRPGGAALVLPPGPKVTEPAAGPGGQGAGRREGAAPDREGVERVVVWDLGDGPVTALAGPAAALAPLIGELRVDGAVAGDDEACARWASLLGVPVVRPVVTATAALGAALLAGIGAGVWDAPSAVAWRSARRFDPR